MNIDLHIHTNHSDGHFSTKEILEIAERENLKIISITDHDSVKSYFDIKEEILSFNGTIITGIELSFKKDGRVYDILGYNIDIDIMNDWLLAIYPLISNINNQNRILNEMKEKYSKLGLKFDDNLVIKTGSRSEAYNLIKHSVMSYESNKEIAPEFWGKNFFKLYHTNTKSKFYIDDTKFLPDIHDVIDIIHKAGGVAVLAHSGAYGFSDDDMIEFIQYAINAGIDGLELKYNCHTPHHENIIMSFVEKYNLLTTGGSDFHGGKIKPNVKLGKAFEDKHISSNIITKFLNIIQKN